MALPNFEAGIEHFNHFPSAPANAQRNPREIESDLQEQIGGMISELDSVGQSRDSKTQPSITTSGQSRFEIFFFKYYYLRIESER